MSSDSIDASLVIVSFNTRDLLRECLKSALKECQGLKTELIVVDNQSSDQSAHMVSQEFPHVRLVTAPTNLGFGSANNEAFKTAKGDYIVLLNSDAFFHPGALHKSIARIKENPRVGLAGARLVGREGNWQPSARQFPSVLNEFLQMSGLSTRFPKSKFFGRFNRTWGSPDEICETDWVPGAFAIIPRHVLQQIGGFDPRFFLYYEEVDLCRRIKAAGYQVAYWGDVVVTHWGGESSKTVKSHTFSDKEAQLVLWRMRSELQYFRKHHGWWGAFSVKALEVGWHQLRALKNWRNPNKASESKHIVRLMEQAWSETDGGLVCPPVPWS